MRLTYQQLVILAHLDRLGQATAEQLAEAAPNPFRTLRGLAARGLAEPTPAGWCATPEGRDALRELRALLAQGAA